MITAKLYKFRPFDDKRRCADILENQRLYCSTVRDLNDPFEGMFIKDSVADDGSSTLQLADYRSFGDRVSSHLRVCSLSSSFSDIRLWAHYADSCRGIAIEVEIDLSDERLIKIEYFDKLKTLKESEIQLLSRKHVLSYKTCHWSYEQEYRYICGDEFIDVSGKIRRVLLGPRFAYSSDEIRSLVPAGVEVILTRLNYAKVRVAC